MLFYIQRIYAIATNQLRTLDHVKDPSLVKLDKRIARVAKNTFILMGAVTTVVAIVSLKHRFLLLTVASGLLALISAIAAYRFSAFKENLSQYLHAIQQKKLSESQRNILLKLRDMVWEEQVPNILSLTSDNEEKKNRQNLQEIVRLIEICSSRPNNREIINQIKKID